MSGIIATDVELLAPAGSWESLNAALLAGADAVYFGVGKLNMRSRGAVNFAVDELQSIVRRCHASGAKAYLTLNNILYDDELEEAGRLCAAAAQAQIDAVICHDLAAIDLAVQSGLKIHLSTQANVSNFQALKFYSRFADAVVLARELDLKKIAGIARCIEEQQVCGPSGQLLRLETFVHGALCVAISGKCQMSLAQFNHSANRGDCLQSCRRAYEVRDVQTGQQLVVDNNYVMSPKDLCTIGCLDEIIGAGVRILKVEGRGRPADYVQVVIQCYREAVEAIADGSYCSERIAQWRTRLATVFNRGFWEDGYYLGRTGDEWCGVSGSKATEAKVKVGRVVNYFSKPGVAEIQLQETSVRAGEELLVIGPATGAVRFCLQEMLVNEQPRIGACQGQHFTCKTPLKVRRNDKVFRIEARTARQSTVQQSSV